MVWEDGGGDSASYPITNVFSAQYRNAVALCPLDHNGSRNLSLTRRYRVSVLTRDHVVSSYPFVESLLDRAQSC